VYPSSETWRRQFIMAGRKPWELGGTVRHRNVRPRRRVLIVCEDEKSSRDYFQSFNPTRTEVVAVGTGMNTSSLVDEAIALRNRAQRSDAPYASVWCVFDRDSFPIQNYHRAFKWARDEGIRVAWANEAFELWYLLHFNFLDTALSRDRYAEKLGPLLGVVYDKADASMYARLEARQPTALRNAYRLEKHWADLGVDNPERHNPSTGVHELVEHLNELRELGPA